ncbi:MAG: DUF4136 domain-containing protein [Proteobacteria bacterium]|nr:DUF4136 domain-containing protein [Pseudomonadota bacterium]
MRFLTLLAILFFVAACSKPTIQANVTAFYTPELNTISGKTISVKAHPAEKESSLEFISYRPKIAAKLFLVGFEVEEDIPNPDFIAFVSYGIDGREQRSSTTSSGPTFGSLGVGVGVGRGPVFGGVGQTYNTRTWEEYSRFIAIDIVEAKTAKSENPVRIYEGRVQSVGRCPTLAGVFDQVLDALFEDFPGANGKTTFITIPWDGQC